jgi:hypothetical protein
MLLFISIESLHLFFTGNCTTVSVALKFPSPCLINPLDLAACANPAPCTPPKLVVITGIPGNVKISPSNTLSILVDGSVLGCITGCTDLLTNFLNPSISWLLTNM